MRILFLAISFLFFAGSSPAFSAEPSSPDSATEVPLPADVMELAEVIDWQWGIYFDEGRKSQDDPLIVFGDRLISVAQDHPSREASYLAASFLFRMGHGAPGSDSYRFMTAGMQETLRRHADNPHLSADLEDIGNGGLTELVTEPFLRALLSKTKDATVRAAAVYQLAYHLDSLALKKQHIEKWIENYRDRPPEVFRQIELLRNHLETRELEDLRSERVELFERIIEQHPTERPFAREPSRESPLHVWLRLDAKFVQRPDEPTYGEMAERRLFAIRHLREGCPAPEIVGTDAFGETFRLSDYRGQVVVLMFSFKGCTPCAAIYPILRKQQEHFRDQPVAVLTVMDSHVEGETVESLRKSMEEGTITWRSWWDGYYGPISTRWDVQGWPDLYLIDAEGVIRNPWAPRNDEQKLREEIQALLDEMD